MQNVVSKMPNGFPLGLSEQFWTDDQNIIQWNDFVNRNNLRAESLGNTVGYLRDALAFIFQGINVGAGSQSPDSAPS